MGEPLKSCPFCQSDDIDPVGWASLSATGPTCNACGASAQSVADWNIRAPNPRIAKLEGLLREAQVNFKAGTRNVDLLNRIADALEKSNDH